MTDDFLLRLLGAHSGCWPRLGWHPWFWLLPLRPVPWSQSVLEGADAGLLVVCRPPVFQLLALRSSVIPCPLSSPKLTRLSRSCPAILPHPGPPTHGTEGYLDSGRQVQLRSHPSPPSPVGQWGPGAARHSLDPWQPPPDRQAWERARPSDPRPPRGGLHLPLRAHLRAFLPVLQVPSSAAPLGGQPAHQPGVSRVPNSPRPGTSWSWLTDQSRASKHPGLSSPRLARALTGPTAARPHRPFLLQPRPPQGRGTTRFTPSRLLFLHSAPACPA